jgi:SNF2 family DNA or RNA helicase
MWDHIVEYHRSMLLVPMGMGKTSSVLMAISILLMSGSARKVLVLAPLRVAQSTWPDEAKKWAEFSHLRVSAIIGTPAERLAALKVKADIYTINYDNLVWLIETVGDKWFWDMVVSDEATRLKSFRTKQGGKRAQALGKVAHKRVKRWVGLTGTPVPNGIKDLWGQMWFIDQGARLGSTYTAFMNRWFGFRNAKDAANHAGKAYVERIPFPHAQKEIEVLVKDVCLTLDVKDWFDVKEPVVSTLYVDLPPKQRKHYQEMERELYTVLENNEIEAFGAAAKTIKLIQMASGAAYINGSNDEWVEMHDEKLQALESIIEEAAGASVLVAYHFKSDLARIQRRFPQARVLDKKSQTILDWNEGRIELLLAHPASAGHGLNLQDGGNILVFFSHWWNLEERQQIVERIGPVRQFQAGHDRPVFIHQIVARDTVDEDVIARISTKQDVQDILLQALKRRLEL